MEEMCFCGRHGLLIDGVPTVDDHGIGLQCRACGHLDRLRVCGPELALRIWTQAKESELARTAEPVPRPQRSPNLMNPATQTAPSARPRLAEQRPTLAVRDFGATTRFSADQRGPVTARARTEC